MERITPARPRRILAVALAVIGAVAAALGLWVVVARVMVATRLGAGPLLIHDLAVANAPTPTFLTDDAMLSLTYSGVDLILHDPPVALRWLDYWAVTADASIVALLAALVCSLVLLALRGRPFVMGSATLLMVGGVAVIVASWLRDHLRGQLQHSLIAHLGTRTTAGSEATGTREGFAIVTSYDPSIVAVGLVLFAVGLVFVMASRLQRDVERLV